jgi:hypothetical protein
MLGHPTPVDPVIAAATFKAHLEHLGASEGVKALGVTWAAVDDLRVLARFVGLRSDGAVDPFHVLLGAEFYDLWPPTAAFVDPETLQPPPTSSPWWPLITNPPWGAFHNAYTFQKDGRPETHQLICITFTAEYYMTQHNPPANAVWRKGKHTVAATITRLAELLRPPHYIRPGG